MAQNIEQLLRHLRRRLAAPSDRQMPEGKSDWLIEADRWGRQPGLGAPGIGDKPSAEKCDLKPRLAAVLIFVYPKGRICHVPLLVRPTHLPEHAGQVCLPGGAIESGESFEEAAIREFYEELGCPGHPLELAGLLSPVYVRSSRFLVQPVMAVSFCRPQFAPNPREVSGVLELPLRTLLELMPEGTSGGGLPLFVGQSPAIPTGQAAEKAEFMCLGYRVWGATWRILREFAELLRNLENEGLPITAL